MFNASIAGNVGKDAVTRQAGGSSVTAWSVAVEQRGKDGKTTTWVSCSMWGQRGEAVAQYLTKGSKISAAGELTTREYDGKTYLELNVSQLTLMGGKGGQSEERRGDSSGYGAGGRPSDDMGDEIPFIPETRI